jgi:ADP-ribose pyrophosphatase
VPPIIVKSRRPVVNNSRWRVFLDHLVDDKGNHVPDYLTVEAAGPRSDLVTGVGVLAEAEGRFVLLKSYRHALRAAIWDLPRGFLDEGETPESAAMRELTEETGLSCAPENLRHLCTYAPEPGTMAVRAMLFAAVHCQGTLRQASDELGLQSLHSIEPRDLADMIESGQIDDAGLQLAYHRLRALKISDVFR